MMYSSIAKFFAITLLAIPLSCENLATLLELESYKKVLYEFSLTRLSTLWSIGYKPVTGAFLLIL